MHRSHHTRKEVHEVLCPRHLGILKIAPLITHEFSPLAQAKNLAGEGRMLSHMRSHPDVFREGLAAITESTIRFVDDV